MSANTLQPRRENTSGSIHDQNYWSTCLPVKTPHFFWIPGKHPCFSTSQLPGLLMYIWTGVLPFSDCRNSSWATTRLEVSSVIYKNSTQNKCQVLFNRKVINNLLIHVMYIRINECTLRMLASKSSHVHIFLNLCCS